MTMVRRYLNPLYLLMALVTAIITVVTYAYISHAQQSVDLCGQGVTYRDYSLVGESLVQRKGPDCVAVAKSEQLLLSPLSKFVDSDSAKQLMLKRYQAKVDAEGGVKAYETALKQHLDEMPIGATLYLRPESVWALKAIGVAIPVSPRIAEMGYRVIQPIPSQRIVS